MTNDRTHDMDLLPRRADFVSIEALFIMFVFAGTYKAYQKLDALNARFDLTLTTACLCLLIGALVFVLRGLLPARLNRTCLLFYLAYAALAAWTYFVGGIYSENATLKVQKLLVFNTCSLILPLFVIDSRERVMRVIRLFFCVSVFMGFDSVLRTQTEGFSRFVGTFGTDGYQALGVTAAMGVEIALIAMLFKKRLAARYIFGLIAAVLLVAMILAGARQALAGLIAGLAFVVFALSKSDAIAKYSARWVVGAGLLALAFLVVRSAVLTRVDTSWGATRMLAIFGDRSTDVLADSWRPMLWKAGLDVWEEYPVFGAGFGSFSEVSSFPEARQPHNMFVEMLCEMGLVGLFVGCAFWWFALRQALPRSQTATDPLMLTLGTLWIHLAACAQFSGDVTDNRQMFAFAGLIVTLAASQEIAPQSTAFVAPGEEQQLGRRQPWAA